MKYMILTFASQQQYQEMAGQPSKQPAWTQEDWAALGAFMQAFSQELLDSGELVETRGLSAPVHMQFKRHRVRTSSNPRRSTIISHHTSLI